MKKDTRHQKGKSASVKGTEIVYQNKDITSKFLAEHLKGKSFQVYGLDLPEIQEVLPTNIPTVQAKELRIDNLFLLADGTVAIVDYESKYQKSDKVKYMNYLIGIANRYLAEKKECPPLRMIVIYTGDIQREKVSRFYQIGAIRLETEVAFLSELDFEGIFSKLQQKVEKGSYLTDEELMEFIILPLSYQENGIDSDGIPKKKQKIREVVEIAARIQDRDQQLFTLAGLLAFTDKLIDSETADKIRSVMEMTQVAMIFEKEKQQAVEEVTKKYEEEKKQTFQEMVERMLRRGYHSEEIASLIPGYSESRVEQLREELGLAGE